MQQTTQLICPKCDSSQLLLKYAVTYEYSYMLDANAPGRCNSTELLPYLYDKREQTESQQYIECSACGATFPCYFDQWDKDWNPAALQKALSSKK